MDIILVSGRLATARTITVSLPQLAVLGFGTIAAMIAFTTAMNYTLLRYAADLNVPLVQRLLASMKPEDTTRSESYLRESLNTMAVRIGQMQAELLRLDSLGERLAKLAGFKSQDLMFGQKPVEYPSIPRTIHEPWKWTHPTYVVEINRRGADLSKVQIDPTQRLADVRQQDNVIDLR